MFRVNDIVFAFAFLHVDEPYHDRSQCGGIDPQEAQWVDDSRWLH